MVVVAGAAALRRVCCWESLIFPPPLLICCDGLELPEFEEEAVAVLEYLSSGEEAFDDVVDDDKEADVVVADSPELDALLTSVGTGGVLIPIGFPIVVVIVVVLCWFAVDRFENFK